MNCKLCTHKYNKNERKPFVLIPCGHTYCSCCVTHLKNKEIQPFTCPKCKKRVKSETLNLDLLEMLSMNLIVDVNAELRQSILKDLKEIKKLKSKLELNCEHKLNDSKSKIHLIRTQMNKRIDSFNAQFHDHIEMLVCRLDDLEKSMLYSIDEFISAEPDTNYETTCQKVKNLDEMDRNQLNDLKQELAKIKQKLDTKSNKLDELEFNYEFKSNYQLNLSNTIGSITSLALKESAENALQEANQKIKEADLEEKNNNHEQALALYQETIELLRFAIKSDGFESKKKQSLKDLCQKYTEKVDKLHTLVCLTQKFSYKKKRQQLTNDENDDPECKKKMKASTQLGLYKSTNELGKSFDFVIEKIAANLFAHFDRDKKKTIGFDHFKQIVDIFTLPEAINLEKLRSEFEQADADQDDQISLNGLLFIII